MCVPLACVRAAVSSDREAGTRSAAGDGEARGQLGPRKADAVSPRGDTARRYLQSHIRLRHRAICLFVCLSGSVCLFVCLIVFVVANPFDRRGHRALARWFRAVAFTRPLELNSVRLRGVGVERRISPRRRTVDQRCVRRLHRWRVAPHRTSMAPRSSITRWTSMAPMTHATPLAHGLRRRIHR